MSLLLTSYIAQIFFPICSGIFFFLFKDSSKSVKNLYFNIGSFAYTILGLVTFFLIGKERTGELVNIGNISLFLQGDLYFFVFCSILGYFAQGRKIISSENNMFLIFFLHGMFFTAFNISIFSKGLVSVYAVIEVLCFLLMILTVFFKKSQKNIVLQGLGTSFMFIVLIMIYNFSGKNWERSILFQEIFSVMLLLGLLLKSTLLSFFEKKPSGDNILTVYYSIIKLYVPARIIYEISHAEFFELNRFVKLVIMFLVLIHCARVEKLRGEIDIINLATLFGWISISFIILGMEYSLLINKHAFLFLLLFLFYGLIQKSKNFQRVYLIAFILSLMGFFSSFFIELKKQVLFQGGQVLLPVLSFIIIYMMLKIIWQKMITGSEE